MQKISIFFTEESIETIKRFGSFARVVNILLTILREDAYLQAKVSKRLKELGDPK